MLSKAVDVVFPRSCAGCASGPWPFCEACTAALVPLLPPWCHRCGRPSPEQVQTCSDCPPSEISVARSPFLFHGPARRAIHRLKFSGWRSVADALAAAMVAARPPPADVVTWVPLARARLSSRGFDQAKALARAVAVRGETPAEELLRRATDAGPQAQRRGAERREAVRDAFRPTGRRAPSSVLLVDDVLTTGATAAACARALREAGAGDVMLLTAARAFSGSLPARYTRATGPRPGLWLPGDAPR